jgi:hypothetical protein
LDNRFVPALLSKGCGDRHAVVQRQFANVHILTSLICGRVRHKHRNLQLAPPSGWPTFKQPSIKVAAELDSRYLTFADSI